MNQSNFFPLHSSLPLQKSCIPTMLLWLERPHVDPLNGICGPVRACHHNMVLTGPRPCGAGHTRPHSPSPRACLSSRRRGRVCTVPPLPWQPSRDAAGLQA